MSLNVKTFWKQLYKVKKKLSNVSAIKYVPEYCGFCYFSDQAWGTEVIESAINLAVEVKVVEGAYRWMQGQEKKSPYLVISLVDIW